MEALRVRPHPCKRPRVLKPHRLIPGYSHRQVLPSGRVDAVQRIGIQVAAFDDEMRYAAIDT
jgi:hypothetical protein